MSDMSNDLILTWEDSSWLWRNYVDVDINIASVKAEEGTFPLASVRSGLRGMRISKWARAFCWALSACMIVCAFFVSWWFFVAAITFVACADRADVIAIEGSGFLIQIRCKPSNWEDANTFASKLILQATDVRKALRESVIDGTQEIAENEKIRSIDLQRQMKEWGAQESSGNRCEGDALETFICSEVTAELFQTVVRISSPSSVRIYSISDWVRTEYSSYFRAPYVSFISYNEDSCVNLIYDADKKSDIENFTAQIFNRRSKLLKVCELPFVWDEDIADNVQSQPNSKHII